MPSFGFYTSTFAEARHAQRASYGEPSASASLASLHAFLDGMDRLRLNQPPHAQELVRPIITPRFAPVCSDELLSGLSQHLPDVINHLTPDGRLPTESELSGRL